MITGKRIILAIMLLRTASMFTQFRPFTRNSLASGLNKKTPTSTPPSVTLSTQTIRLLSYIPSESRSEGLSQNYDPKSFESDIYEWWESTEKVRQSEERRTGGAKDGWSKGRQERSDDRILL